MNNPLLDFSGLPRYGEIEPAHIAQAIDESSLQEQEGTLAGDNTLLVLFADDVRLERWRSRFEAIQRSIAEVPAPV